jgi:hypothetical protein
MDPSRKRQRANTNGDAAPVHAPLTTPILAAPPALPQYDLLECIEALDAADDGALTRQMLLNLAGDIPGVADNIRTYYDDLIRREQRKVISFDHTPKTCGIKSTNNTDP